MRVTFSRFYLPIILVLSREVVITSIFDEDPTCVGIGGYAIYRLSDGQNLLPEI